MPTVPFFFNNDNKTNNSSQHYYFMLFSSRLLLTSHSQQSCFASSELSLFGSLQASVEKRQFASYYPEKTHNLFSPSSKIVSFVLHHDVPNRCIKTRTSTMSTTATIIHQRRTSTDATRHDDSAVSTTATAKELFFSPAWHNNHTGGGSSHAGYALVGDTRCPSLCPDE